MRNVKRRIYANKSNCSAYSRMQCLADRDYCDPAAFGIRQSWRINTIADCRLPVDHEIVITNKRFVPLRAESLPNKNDKNKKTADLQEICRSHSGSRIRTYDLRVMSPTSYQTALSRSKILIIKKSSGSRIRTYDLRVMSPTSYQTALSRTNHVRHFSERERVYALRIQLSRKKIKTFYGNDSLYSHMQCLADMDDCDSAAFGIRHSAVLAHKQDCRLPIAGRSLNRHNCQLFHTAKG